MERERRASARETVLFVRFSGLCVLHLQHGGSCGLVCFILKGIFIVMIGKKTMCFFCRGGGGGGRLRVRVRVQLGTVKRVCSVGLCREGVPWGGVYNPGG